jgi:hypothetical protein
MRRLLLFGMAPGSGGRESQRELHRKYLPVLARIGPAGWQPVTHARAGSPGLLIERFGAGPGNLYMVLRNPGDAPLAGRVVFDAGALGLAARLADLRVSEILEKRPVRTAPAGPGKLAVETDLRAGEVLVLSVEESRG